MKFIIENEEIVSLVKKNKSKLPKIVKGVMADDDGFLVEIAPMMMGPNIRFHLDVMDSDDKGIQLRMSESTTAQKMLGYFQKFLPGGVTIDDDIIHVPFSLVASGIPAKTMIHSINPIGKSVEVNFELRSKAI